MKRTLFELTLPGNEKALILLDFLRKKWFFAGPPQGKTVWKDKVTQALEGALQRDASTGHGNSFQLLDTSNQSFTTLDLNDIYEKTAPITGGTMQWSDFLAHNQPLSGTRRTAQKVLRDLIPLSGLTYQQMASGAKVGSKRYDRFMGNVTKTDATNCVDFPKVYMYHLSEALFGKGNARTFPHAWKFIRGGKSIKGRKQCAIMRNTVPWPLPGDIFVVCYGQQLSEQKGHVGVIYEINDPNEVNALIWTTVDLGQGGGHAAAWVRRTYDPKNATLTGDAKILAPRALMEWLDIEEYYGLK